MSFGSAAEGTPSDELAFQTGVGKPPGKPGKPRKVATVFTIGGATVTVTEP